MFIGHFCSSNPVVETNRCVLRPLNKNDITDLQELLSDKSIYKYWSTKAKDEDEIPCLLFSYEEYSLIGFHWGIQFKRKVVGELWLFFSKMDSIVKLAYRVSPTHQGKGIATESVRAMVKYCFSNHIRYIWADVFVCNKASMRVLEKSGFSKNKFVVNKDRNLTMKYDYYIYGIRNDSH